MRFLDLFPALGQARWVDVLDIGIVSLLIYLLLAWLRERAAERLRLPLFLVLLFYVAIRLLDMRLAALVFQSGFAVFAVAAVLIYQEDIRRFLEKIVHRGRSQGRREPAYLEVAGIVHDAVRKLSADRVGALVVLSGRVPLSPFIRGGIPLEGKVSRELLLSLFDPHSPGHDGAIVIEGKRVGAFGVQLPLSRNLDKTSRRGTRHAAALGLAEQTDALLLCVSEETGSVSVAQDGDIRVVSDAEARSRILAFLREMLIHEGVRSPRRRLFHRMPEKAFAVASAAVLWMGIATNPDQDHLQRTLEFAVSYRNLPADWIVDEPLPSRCRITLSGSSGAFQELTARESILYLDLGALRQQGKQVFAITHEALRLPAGLTVQRMEPGTVEVAAYRSKTLTVPVGPRVETPAGRSSSDYVIRISPETVQLRLREKDPGPAIVSTEPVDLSGIDTPTTLLRRLVQPPDARFTTKEIPTARIHIRPRRRPAG